MPRRHPQPFWRSSKNCWYVQLGKSQKRLSPDREEAFRLYHELMAQQPGTVDVPAVQSFDDDPLVVELCDLFLEWTLANKAKATYKWYLHNIQMFVDSIARDLRVSRLKPFHVTQAMDAHTDWMPNTKWDFARAVQRAFNWAVDQGLIASSPVKRVLKPTPEPRDLVISPTDFELIMANVADPRLRDLLVLAWETGARVQELRKIEARFVNLAESRIVFPPREAKCKKYYRVVYLATDRAREIVERLCRANPFGAILRSGRGTPWTKNSINCAFVRLRARIGRQIMERNGIVVPRPARLNKKAIPADELPTARKSA
jgi:integrase